MFILLHDNSSGNMLHLRMSAITSVWTDGDSETMVVCGFETHCVRESADEVLAKLSRFGTTVESIP